MMRQSKDSVEKGQSVGGGGRKERQNGHTFRKKLSPPNRGSPRAEARARAFALNSRASYDVEPRQTGTDPATSL